jgi:DNA-binding response OmpR family regulator
MPQTGKILVVDDEPELCKVVAEYLMENGFQVSTANSSDAARSQFEHEVPDLALLDVRMPGEDGLSLARWIRELYSNCGIIMLTTQAELVDRIVGLEIGADDYMPKPFDLRELLARVRSVLRRRTEPDQASTTRGKVAFGNCILDLKAHKLFDKDGREIPLTAKEFELLKVFAERPNHVLNRDQLMELAHNKDWEVYDRSIDLRIMRLRKKIEENPEKPSIIKTVRSVGYMFVDS